MGLTKLPSIRELGLWGTAGASEDVAMPDLRRSQTASPSNIDAYSPRFIKTEDQDHHASPQLQPAPTLRASHYTGSSLSVRDSKAYPSIFALEPRDPFYISLPPSSTISRRALPPPPNRRSTNPSSSPRRRSLSSRQPSSTPFSYRIEKPKTQRAKPKNTTGEAHCNEKYTQEENFFLIHHRGDLAMPWKQVERLFDQRFCSGGTGVSGSGRPYRREGGVQSQYYRLNARCPQMNGPDKLLVFGPRPGGVHDRGVDRFDENDNLVFECKVRRGIKRSLVERYAEQVVEGRYEWIPEEVMREAERLGESFVFHFRCVPCLSQFPPEHSCVFHVSVTRGYHMAWHTHPPFIPQRSIESYIPLYISLTLITF
ncbi:hypothetical protein GE09DRAFT_99889 [Coniochaeta sp. 2T2.1]|nr:hypothetical protein GE09DRAFT_99889 [Coniochaeta sp. 2T2.1]